MDVVVMAAGEGTRMRPLTTRRPKPLLPVGTTTLLERLLAQCESVADRFVLVIGYRGQSIVETIGSDFRGIPVEYVEQTNQRGTADAIATVESWIDDRFLVLNGDVVVDEAAILNLADSPDPAMAVRDVAAPEQYGVVDREGDRITGLVEKPDDPPTSLANAGMYAFDPSIFEAIEAIEPSERGEYEITDAISSQLEAGTVMRPIRIDGFWLDVGRPWELLEANESVVPGLETDLAGRVDPNARLTGTVVVEAGATIRAGSVIQGPCVIRSGAEIGPNAFLRGTTVVGPEARVGHGVEVKNSILFDRASVAHIGYVGDSILAEDVNFGAGTTVANLRHDDKTVGLTVKGERVDTGRRKLGVIVGPGAKTGIDTSLNAGVTLPAGGRTGPNETILRDPEPNDEE